MAADLNVKIIGTSADNIDLTATGDITVLSALNDFIPLDLIVLIQTITALTVNPQLSYGKNATTYNNMGLNTIINLGTCLIGDTFRLPVEGKKAIIDNTDVVKVKINTGATATVLTGKFLMLGIEKPD